MKLIVSIFIFIVLNLQYFYAIAESDTQSLRDGYRLQVLKNESGKTTQLFHQNKLLGNSHNYSIAPSGEYAAFQNSPGGKLYLYRVSDGVLEKLAEKSPGTVKNYQWNETLEVVKMYFDNQQETLSFAIE